MGNLMEGKAVHLTAESNMHSTPAESNFAYLSGRVLQGPVFNHKTYGEAFYIIVLGILRKSGYEDRIRLIVSEKLLGGRSPRVDELLEIHGQIRTYNREADGKNHLEVTVFVREFSYCTDAGWDSCFDWETERKLKNEFESENDFDNKFQHYEEFKFENLICLEGFICKPPIRRTSPMGREICDMMVAVNRMYNKSDYIPCIAWGRNAAYAGQLEVGDKISIEGRIQSREYRKYDESGELVEKTAYEVSVMRIEQL